MNSTCTPAAQSNQTANLTFRAAPVPDFDIWNELVEAYRPLIRELGRNHGLTSFDADLVVQDVVKTMSRSIATFEFDTQRDRLGSWLFAITKTKVASHQRVRQVNAMAAIELAADWDRVFEQLTIQHAFKRIEKEFASTTWSVFWATAVQHRKSQEVANEHRLSLGAVNHDRDRVLGRLKGWIRNFLNEEPDFIDRL